MFRSLGTAERTSQPAFAALRMARRSEFEGRMLSILDPVLRPPSAAQGTHAAERLGGAPPRPYLSLPCNPIPRFRMKAPSSAAVGVAALSVADTDEVKLPRLLQGLDTDGARWPRASAAGYGASEPEERAANLAAATGRLDIARTRLGRGTETS